MFFVFFIGIFVFFIDKIYSWVLTTNINWYLSFKYKFLRVLHFFGVNCIEHFLFVKFNLFFMKLDRSFKIENITIAYSKLFNLSRCFGYLINLHFPFDTFRNLEIVIQGFLEERFPVFELIIDYLITVRTNTGRTFFLLETSIVIMKVASCTRSFFILLNDLVFAFGAFFTWRFSLIIAV